VRGTSHAFEGSATALALAAVWPFTLIVWLLGRTSFDTPFSSRRTARASTDWTDPVRQAPEESNHS
jgi:hypothetical protein